MNRRDWEEIYATHVVDNSDAERKDAETMAHERADQLAEDFGEDADHWPHPHDEAVSDMEHWDRSGDEEE